MNRQSIFVFLLIAIMAQGVFAAPLETPQGDRSKMALRELYEMPDPYRADRYNARHPKTPFSSHVITDKSSVPTDADKIVLILVNTSLLSSIQSDLDTYEQDLIDQGYQVAFATAQGGSQDDIRAMLQGYYATWGTSFNGCMLVGQLPIPWFEHHEDYDVFGCDLFYADMDGTWEDTDHNSIYDRHTDGSGDTKPEIWIGRVTAHDMSEDEVTLVKKFFDNNHQYRMEKRRLPRRALVYIDDDWVYWWYEWDDAFAYLRHERDFELDEETTNATDYESRFDDEYEWLSVSVHSNYNLHGFKINWGWDTDYYYWSELKEQNPRFHFYITFACINADYSEPDYMSGWYLFGGDYGQLVLGSTKSGGFYWGDEFFESLAEGENIGDAYKNWFSNEYPYDDEDTGWWYGLTLLGDPALYVGAGPYSVCDCEAYTGDNPTPIDYIADGGKNAFAEVELWYRFSTDGENWSPDWCDSGLRGYNSSGEIPFPLDEGEGFYEFYTISIDSEDNREDPPATADATTLYDLTAPDSTASSPDYSSGSGIRVDFTASDNASGVSHTTLWYKFETGSWTDTVLVESGESGAFQFTPGDGEGTYYFQTVCEDNVGNVESGPSADGDDSTLIDGTDPVSSCESPDLTGSELIHLTYNASDAGGSGISEVRLWYKFGAGGTWTDTGLSESGPSGVFDFTAPDGSGAYYFQTISEDVVGNFEDGPGGNGDDFTVLDQIAPQSYCSAPEFANGQDIAIGFEASDAGGAGISEVALWYRASSGEWTDTGQRRDTETGSFVFTPQDGDRAYYFQTVATDTVDNTEASPSGDGDDSTLYDTVEPASACTSPDYSQAISIDVGFSSSDESGSGIYRTLLYYKFESGAWTYSGQQMQASGEFGFTAGGGDGVYQFQTIAEDRAGNTEAGPDGDGDSQTILDQTSPNSLCWASDYATTVPFDVFFASSDGGSGVNRTRLYYRFAGEGDWEDSLLVESGETGSFALDPTVITPQFGDGEYELLTISTDNAGNVEPPDTPDDSIILDRTAPVSTCDTENEYSSAATVTIQYSASDSLTGITLVRLYVSRNDSDWGYADLQSDEAASDFVYDFGGLDGTYRFVTVATDGAGNIEDISEARSCTVKRDIGAPSSTSESPELSNDAYFDVDFEITDAVSGGYGVQLYARFSTEGTNSFSGDFEYTGLYETGEAGSIAYEPPYGPGFYELFTIARDKAGNFEAMKDAADCATEYNPEYALSSCSSAPETSSAMVEVSYEVDVGEEGFDHVELWYKYSSDCSDWPEDWADTGLVSGDETGKFDFDAEHGDGCYRFATIALNQNMLSEPFPRKYDCQTSLDETIPSSVMSGPSLTGSAPVTLFYDSDDSNGEGKFCAGIAQVEIWYSFDGTPVLYEFIEQAPATIATGSVQFSPAHDGIYEIWSIAIDGFGNREEAPAEADISLTVDFVAPTSAASCDTFGQGFPVAVAFTALDAMTEILEVSLWAKYESGSWEETGLSGSGETGTLYYTPATAQEGSYQFYTVATDHAGHTEAAPDSADDQVLIDWTAPTSSCSSPEFSSDATIELGYTASDSLSGMSSVSAWIKVGDAAWVDTGSSGPADGGVIELDVSSWGEGTFGFCTRGRDNSGNIENLPEAIPTTTVYDETAPDSAASLPSEGIFANSTPINIPYTASDALSGLDTVELWFSLDGGDWQPYGLPQTPSSFSLAEGTAFSFAPPEGDGTYAFATIAQDVAGNRESLPETPDGGSLVFDQASPSSSVSYGSTYAPKFPVSLPFTAEDLTSGVASVALFVSINGSAFADTGLRTSGTEGQFEYTPDVIADGIYSFYSIATDKAGNVETAPSKPDATVTFDLDAPVSKADVSADYAIGYPIQVTYSASDSASGLDRIRLWVSFDGATFEYSGLSSQNSTGTFSYTPTAQADGIYSFYTIASDHAGNVETAPSEADDFLIVDAKKPTSSCSIEASIANAFPIAIDYSSSDSGSGVDYVRIYYRVDYGLWLLADTLPEAEGSYDFTPEPVRDGFFEFRSKAYDRASNAETVGAADDSITVDTTPPVSSANSAPSVDSLPLYVSFSSRDNGTGVADTRLWYKHGQGSWNDSGLNRTGTAGQFEFDCPDGQGTYSFYTVCTDIAGNIEAAPSSPDTTTEYHVSSPDISSDVTSLEFGQVDVGESGSKKVTITNIGDGDLTVESIFTDDSLFEPTFDGSLPARLEPSEELEIEISFTPNAEGEFEATLTITSDDADTPSLTIGLSGEGIETSGELTVGVSTNAETYSFGDTLSVQASILNTGAAIPVDLYLVMSFDLGGPEERHWSASLSGSSWTDGIVPLLSSFEVAAGFDLDIPWWSSTLPCSVPMLAKSGTYMLRMAAVEPGTLNLVSNFAVSSFILDGDPFIGVSMDKDSYALSGDTVMVSLDVDVQCSLTADAYVLLLGPNGQFWSPTGFGDVAWSAGVSPLIAGINLDGGFTFSGTAFTKGLPAAAPFDGAGAYTLFTALVEPGTLSPLSDIGTASFSLQ
ncbi:MAG: choice-of-anchor D domain-containing protein [Candidatus Coatesbacteria bacterium]|nr:choice-of-anchor D domain-containing protein [Candidatus Coatesbacteria bacterium]